MEETDIPVHQMLEVLKCLKMFFKSYTTTDLFKTEVLDRMSLLKCFSQ